MEERFLSYKLNDFITAFKKLSREFRVFIGDAQQCIDYKGERRGRLGHMPINEAITELSKEFIERAISLKKELKVFFTVYLPEYIAREFPTNSAAIQKVKEEIEAKCFILYFNIDYTIECHKKEIKDFYKKNGWEQP